MSINLDGIWRRGLDVLSTVLDSVKKTITASTGDSVGEETISPNAEWWQHVGFASRPSKPTKGRPSAQVVQLIGSDVDCVIASRDTRFLDIYGNLGHGETCVFATGETGTGQARALLKGDGSINLYTRVGNTSAGAGMVVQVTPSDDSIRITNGAGYGLIINGDGVTLTAGDAALTLNASAGTFSLVGTGQCVIDGSPLVACQGPTPPVVGINSCVIGPTGVAGRASTKFLVGA